MRLIRSLGAIAGLGLLLGACFNPNEDPRDITDTLAGTGSSSGGDPTTTPTSISGTTTSTTDATGTATGGGCSMIGCTCATEADCDDGLICRGNVCAPITCGDGMIEGAEQCEDGDKVDGNGCDNDCSYTELTLDVSFRNTCVLIEGGRVRCWGEAFSGQLGYGNQDRIGDDETPASAGDVMLPGPVGALASGDSHVCATAVKSGETWCFGGGFSGALGYGNTDSIGDDEFPSTLGAVDIGVAITDIAPGGSHNCARTNAGTVRCWGDAFNGQLGYGNTDRIGDDELPSAVGDVQVGAAVTTLASGIFHTCAVQSNGLIKCWGQAFNGELGYGNTNLIGDDETPQFVQALDFGESPTDLVGGLNHTCALFPSGVRCWGAGSGGQLGTGAVDSIGDDELATTATPIDLGVTAVALTAGDNHTCILTDTGTVRCWGQNFNGQLGYGNTDPVGDDETPASVGDVDVGGTVIQVDAGGDHTCVVFDDYTVRCWGVGFGGALGYANTDNVGDDELPSAVGLVEVL